MRYRPFGRTGLEVSELVFGGGWVGGILIHQDDATKRAAIERALEAGINWIDTAPSYGDGESKRRSAGCSRRSTTSPTSRPRCGSISSRLDDIPGQVEQSLEESLSRLRCDSVELFQLHNPIGRRPTIEAIGVDQVLGEDGVADALERMREQGLTRFIGITAIGETAACREVIASGRFDSAQVYYNMLNPSAGQDMPPAWRATTSRPDRRLQGARRRGHEHPRARRRRARERAAPRPRGADRCPRRDPDRGERARGRSCAPRRALRHPRPDRDPLRARQSRHRLRGGRPGRAQPSGGGAGRMGRCRAGPLPDEALAELAWTCRRPGDLLWLLGWRPEAQPIDSRRPGSARPTTRRPAPARARPCSAA